MRPVIVGADGQLGRALAARYPEAVAVDREHLDISDQAVVEAFDWTGVDTLLNAAAYTNVDGAETAAGRIAAWKVNATGVANLARIAIAKDLTLVHISSEYVFDGTQTPHTEDEPLSPLGVYAQSKAAGDVAVGLAAKHYLIRTSWVIGDGANFVRTMMNLAAKDISPKVVDDQIGRPTFTGQLVDAIDYLLIKRPEFGTYNVSNGGETASWAEVTKAIFAELGRDDLTVTPITTAEYFAGKPEAAPRPLESALDLTKIQATGLKLTDWREALADYVKQEKS